MLLNFLKKNYTDNLLTQDKENLPLYFYNDDISIIFIPLHRCKCCGGVFGYEYNKKSNTYQWYCVCYKDIKKTPCNYSENDTECNKNNCELHIKEGEANESRNYFFTLFIHDITRTLWQKGQFNLILYHDEPLQLEMLSAIRFYVESKGCIIYCCYMFNHLLFHVEYNTPIATFKLYILRIWKKIRLFFEKYIEGLFRIHRMNDNFAPLLNYIFCFLGRGKKGNFEPFKDTINNVYRENCEKSNK